MTPGKTLEEPQTLLDLLEELTRLASGLCQEAGVQLALGDRWAWAPEERRILVRREDLLTFPLDACAGIVAHEAGHHLISRYLLFPEGRPVQELDRFALNAIEDARVEAFLALRYPGVGPWILRARQLDRSMDGPLAMQFLVAIAGSSLIPPESLSLDPRVYEALVATKAARHRAIMGFLPPENLDPQGLALQPGSVEQPSQEPHHTPPREAFLRSLAWASLQAGRPILEMAWALHRQDLAAGWPALSGQPRRVLGGRLEEASPAREAPPMAPPGPPGRPGTAFPGLGGLSLPRAPESPAGGALVRFPGPRLPPRPDAYEQAWLQVASQTEELGAALERVLMPRQRLRWRAGFPTGQRVDLRSAMRAEADPRYLGQVWSRKTVPSRRRSAFGLLVDLSGSMAHEGRIEATMAAVALFSETLTRLGVPFRVDGFQDELIPFLDFDDLLDPAHRRRLATMPLEVRGERPGGHNRFQFNDDGPCLLAAAHHLLARPEEDRVLLVLCDGAPEGSRSGLGELEQAIRQLQPRLTLVGLGLGPDTEHVARLYPVARANLPVASLAS